MAKAGTNNYDSARFVRASELAQKVRYCGECGDLEAVFSFEEFQADGCDGHPVARYTCEECGAWRTFGVMVDA